MRKKLGVGETLPPPTKGVKPHTEGVAGALFDEAPADVMFGVNRSTRTSPYDPLLLQLKTAGAGKYLRFDDLRAKSAIKARAKKLEMKILFGEQGNLLWVALAKAELHTNGKVDPVPVVERKTDSALVLEALQESKRDTPGQITSWIRSNGNPDIALNTVDAMLSSLARAGKVHLKTKPKGDETERWRLA
jgi:hypothetical protein